MNLRIALALLLVCLAYWLTACGGCGDEPRTYTPAEASDHARAWCGDKRGLLDADFRADLSPPRAFFVCGDGSAMSVELRI